MARALKKTHPESTKPNPTLDQAKRPAARWAAWIVERGFWITLAVAILARLAHWMVLMAADPLYAQPLAKCDMETYWLWARDIAGGDWLSRTRPGPFYYGPLYAYVLAALMRLFGPNFHVVHGAQAAMGVLVPVLLYATTLRLFGKGAALATGLLAAFCAPFLFYEQMLLMEGLLLAIHAALLYCFVAGQEGGKRKWLWAGAAGALSGLACLGRGNFLLVVPFLAAVWLAASWRTRTDTDKHGQTRTDTDRIFGRRLFLTAAYLLGAALVLSLSLWRNVHVSGQWVLTTSNGPILLYYGNASDSRGVFFTPPSVETLSQAYGSQSAVPWGRELLKDVANQPLAFIALMVKKTWIFWNSYDSADNVAYYLGRRYSPLLAANPVTWQLLLPLALLGIWDTRKTWRQQIFLYVYAAAFSVSIIAILVVGRYRLEEMLPMLIWSGPATAAFARLIFCSRLRKEADRSGVGQVGQVGQVRPVRLLTSAATVGRLLFVALGVVALWPRWSPAVAYNSPKKYPGYRLIRPNEYNRLALAHLEIGQRAKGMKILEEAFSVYPFLKELAFPLAAMQIEDQEPWKAVETLSHYIRTAGVDRDALIRLAEAFHRCGRNSDAAETLRSILRVMPNDAEAAAMLKRIEAK